MKERASATIRRLFDQLSLHGARDPRIARVYDGCTDGLPWFDAEHPVIVDATERDSILRLLRGGGIVLHSDARIRDEISGEDSIVSADLRSNGIWIWSDAATYYLENHWLAPDADLVAHLSTTKPLALNDDTWQRLYAAIRSGSWEGMTWPLD